VESVVCRERGVRVFDDDGFLHEVLADIEAVHALLGEQYKPDSVLRELLQNADDAGARRVFFAIRPGALSPLHPLLAPPQLIVANDGPFHDKDAAGIRSLRAGTKADNDTAIGKFGLGLKSVFHLCEAFLFAGAASHSARPTGYVLNPWRHERSDWGTGGEKARLDALVTDLHRWVEGRWLGKFPDGWFALSLPLRTQAFLKGRDPILRHFPKESEVLAIDTVCDLAWLLPSLRQVEEIEAECYGGVIVRIRRVPGDQRFSSPKVSKPGVRPLNGTVEVEIAGVKRRRVSWRGLEWEPGSETNIFAALKEEDDWPKRTTRLDNGSTERRKEKAWPHAGVLFIAGEGTGQISTQHAVFLPLGDSLSNEAGIAGKNIQLLLHATFFVESSRRRLHASSDGDVESRWNQELLNRGVLPLVIPALEAFVSEQNLSFPDVAQLTAVLQQTPPIETKPATLFKGGSWLPCWTPSGGEYKHLEPGNPYRQLRRQSQANLFPNLSMFAAQELVALGDYPALTGDDPQDWKGTLTNLGITINLRSAAALRDLLDFLQANQNLSSTDWQVVRVALASALADAGKEGRQRNIALVRQILTLLPQGSVVQMAADRLDRVPGLWQGIARMVLPCLIVPKDIAPEGDETPAHLPADAGLILLKWCADQLVDVLDAQVNSNARWIVTFVGEIFQRIAPGDVERRDLRAVKALRAQPQDPNNRSAFTLSLDEVHGLAREKRLFTSRATDLDDLQLAMPDVAFVRLLDDIGIPILGILDSSPDHLASLLDGSLPVAPTSGNRVKLLKKFIESGEGTISKYERVIRLLLHGKVAHAGDLTTPLVIPSRTEPIWAKLHAHLQKALHSSWSVLDSGIVRHLDDAQRDRLKLFEIGSSSVEAQLQTLSDEQLESLPVEEADIRAVLTGIREINLWRRLSLHATSHKTRTRLNGQVFLPGSIPVPRLLQDQVTLLADPGELRSRYEGAGVVAFDHNCIVRLALAEPSTPGMAELILEALQAGATITDSVKTVAWLPQQDGAVAAPISLLPLGDRRPDWAKAVHHVGGHVLPSRLTDSVRGHPYFSQLSACAPEGIAAAEKLLTCLVRSSRFSLPDIQPRVLRDAFGAAGLPGLETLTVLGDELNLPLERIDVDFAPYLTCWLDSQRTAELLAILAQSDNLSSARKIAAVLMRDWDDEVPIPAELMLPSQVGAWKRADQLCQGIGQLDDSFCLHEEIKLPIRASVEAIPLDQSHRVELLQGSPTELETDLADVFSGWEDVGVRSQTIALLGVVLGSTPGGLDFAAKLLGSKGEAEAYRQRFLDDSAKSFTFAVVPRPLTPDLRVKSLANTPLKARTAKELKYLFWRRSEIDPDTRVIQLPLWRLRSDDGTFPVETEKLTELLIDVIFNVADRDLTLTPPARRALEELVESTREPEQAEVERIQSDLADRAFDYLETDLGRRATPELRKLAQRWRDARRKRAEGMRHPDEHQRSRNLLQYEKEAQHLAEQLVALLHDPTQANDVLEAVRTRLRESQYGSDTIPFELFQNADDAALQLSEMDPNHPPCTIAFRWRVDALTCLHTGRCINTFRMKAFSAQEGRQRGYDLDLEKMLRLGASGKGQTEGPALTGRFGLGFKSVYLLTDRPELLSGRKSEAIAVAIEGGLLPAPLTAEARDRLDKLRNNLPYATVLRLPARSEKNIADVIQRFEQLAALQVIFSRALRTCRIDSPAGIRDVKWRPMKLSRGVEVGEAGKMDAAGTGRYLFLSAGKDRAGIVVACNVLGPESLPDRVPTFWVTTPTQEYRRRGIAVNGSFAIDIGRAQLARDDSENRERITQMGRYLGDTLVALYDTLPERLGASDSPFAPDATPDRFWRQWWEVVAAAGHATQQADAEPGDRLLHRLLFGAKGAVSMLAQQRDAIPTGLAGSFDTMTSAGRVEGVVTGALLRREVFLEASSWPCLKRWTAGSLVASSVAELLGIDAEKWDLARCIRIEVPESGHVDPGTARRIGIVLGDVLAGTEPDEQAKIREVLRLCRFRTRSDVWRDANSVVIPTSQNQPDRESDDARDEARRAGFAPPDWILHNDYLQNPDTLAFVLACRDKRNFDVASRLVEWGRAATTSEAKAAYEEYRLTGNLAGRLNALDPPVVRHTDSTTTHSSLTEGDDEDDHLLAGDAAPESSWLFRPNWEVVQQDWNANSNRYHAEWDQRLYPDDGVFFTLLDEEPRTEAQRVAWLTLLVRGSLESMGRSNWSQHREFLRLCQERGWLVRMASSSREERRLIVDDLEDWVRPAIQATEYYHWLRYLLPALLLAPWIEEYAFGLCALNRVSSFDPNRDLVAMRLGQARVDAPPLGPYLGMGAHFVLRELVRHGIVTNDQVHSACFVPRSRVRQQLGVSDSARHVDASQSIFEALEGRTFQLGFDLALENQE